MRQVLKACPCVVVENRILVFKHPDASYQIPKGTVEDEESIEEAVVRELEEESGISTGKIIKKVGELEWYIEPGTATFTRGQHQLWHIYLIDPGKVLPETWEHVATGHGIEVGKVFSFFWHPLDETSENFHPVYLHVMELISEHLARLSPSGQSLESQKSKGKS